MSNLTSATDPTLLSETRVLPNHFFSIRYWGPALQARRVKPPDQAGGRGEGSTAAWHPHPFWEAEQCQREPGTKTRSSCRIWQNHCRNRGRIHKGMCLFRSFNFHIELVWWVWCLWTAGAHKLFSLAWCLLACFSEKLLVGELDVCALVENWAVETECY